MGKYCGKGGMSQQDMESYNASIRRKSPGSMAAGRGTVVKDTFPNPLRWVASKVDNQVNRLVSYLKKNK